MKSTVDNQIQYTFGEHLEFLRKMLIRIIIVVLFFSSIIFCFKEQTFKILLAPKNSDFVTYIFIEKIVKIFDTGFEFSPFNTSIISTELSAQFMTHITASVFLGFLLASPYILFELFRFISPALYEQERKISIPITLSIYLLFIIGVVISFFILFPISFRFLSTYQVNPEVINTITLDSYISTFCTLTLVMGLVFQLPVLAYSLGKLHLVDSYILKHYRQYALIIILIVSAIITPPDIFTLILVSLPIYCLYEISITIIKRIEKNEAS